MKTLLPLAFGLIGAVTMKFYAAATPNTVVRQVVITATHEPAVVYTAPTARLSVEERTKLRRTLEALTDSYGGDVMEMR